MNWVKEHWFRLSIVTIFFLAVILIAFYFMVFIPGQERDREATATFEQTLDQIQRQSCAESSELSAVELYENSSLCKGPYAPDDCKDKKTYLVTQYKNAYDICLQRAGLY